MTMNQSSTSPWRPRSAGLICGGCVIGLVSAVVLSFDGTACVSVLDVLLSRDASGAAALGARLVRASWCPIGIALGTTLSIVGLGRLTRQVDRSAAANVLLIVYALFAGLGAFAVASGMGGARASFLVVATSEVAVKAEEIQLAVHEASVPIERGWTLLAIAQVVLVIAAFAQIVQRSERTPTSSRRSNADLVAVLFVCAFGAIASWSWLASGSAIQQLFSNQVIKAADLASFLSSVLSSTIWAAWALVAHAIVVGVISSLRAWQQMAMKDAASTNEP